MVEALCSLIALVPAEWAHYGFMQRALLGIVILAPMFALPGCLVINSQMSFFSDAVGHAALTGIAIGALCGLADPFWAMIIFAAALAVGLSLLRRVSAASTDTLIGIVMAGAVALGIVILSRGGGFARYSRYLIGDILSITAADIAGIAAGAVVLLVLWALCANRLYLSAFNQSIAHSRGHAVWLEETAFSVAIAVLVTSAVPWIGILVINSFLILPAAAARNVAWSLRSYSFVAVAIAVLSGVTGLLLSYYLATATGATMVLVSLGLYVVTLVARIWRRPAAGV
jgi:zinc transport system permease protein